MTTKINRVTRVAGIALVMLATAALACNAPIGGNATATATVTVTAIAEVTNAVAEAPTSTPEAAAAPTDASAPAAAPTATVCSYDAAFITDVTVPDNTEFAPGAAIDKAWRIQSSGCAPWPDGTALAFDHGDQMGAPNSVVVPTAAAGTNIDIHVPMTAPATPGTYKGYWRLKAPDGTLFGQVYVQIVVPAPTATSAPTATTEPTATTAPTATPTNTPVPVTFSTGGIDIPQTYHADLDNGAMPGTGAQQDFWFEAVSAAEKYLTPQNGARFAIWGTSAPGMYDCLNKGKNTNKIALSDLPVGTYVCYKTTEGRPGAFRVNAISGGGSQTLSIGYTTWEKP